MRWRADGPRSPLSISAGLTLVLAVTLVAGCGAATRTQVSAPPLSNQGRLLWQFEALLHDTLGSRPVCASGRWAQKFRSGSCTSLAVASPYVYLFREARHSRFHITSKKAIDFGNYPQPVLLNGRNVACNKQATTFLIKYVDGAGLRLGCSRAGYVSSRSNSTRSCGSLSIGIGWHLRATPNVTCPSARHLIATYFKERANRQSRIDVGGYVCTKRDLRDAEHIGCSRGPRLVAARSFGY